MVSRGKNKLEEKFPFIKEFEDRINELSKMEKETGLSLYPTYAYARIYKNGDILKSDIYCHNQVNTATEYGALIDNGYVIFNDTDAQGDEEVGVMKIINGSNSPTTVKDDLSEIQNPLIKIIDLLGRETREMKNQPLFYIYDNGKVEKKIILE